MIVSPVPQYDFDDVMFLPQLTDPAKGLNSRRDVCLFRRFKTGANRVNEWAGVPIIAANMDTVGTFEMAEALMEHEWCTALHKHYTVDELVEFFERHEDNSHLLFYTMGISDNDRQKFVNFTARYGEPDNICIDVANGYLPTLREAVADVRDLCPNAMIMAGNVVTGDGVYALVSAGASIVKVGIGSGSACTTRRLTGVGRPQLSSVAECANVAHGMNALICSDGGCVEPSHVSKAIGAGADFVMLGGMLAGHDECGGKIISEIQYVPVEPDEEVLTIGVITGEKKGYGYGRKRVPISMEFYGMSSDTAMSKHNGGMKSYKASEGRTLQIPYKGEVKGTIETIMGGIRSTMMYIGAKELKELSKCTTFITVKNQLNTSLAQYE